MKVFHTPTRETRIPGVKEGEDPVFILWRHWIIPATAAGIFVILIALPFLAWTLTSGELTERISGTVWQELLTVLFIVYILLIWLVFATFIVDYYLDTWIVTNQRIVDIEQRGLFRRVVSQHHLTRVQDVTSDVSGIIHTLLNFGDVHIQTAGAQGRFQFTQVPRPNDVKQRIVKLHKAAVQRSISNQQHGTANNGI